LNKVIVSGGRNKNNELSRTSETYSSDGWKPGDSTFCIFTAAVKNNDVQDLLA
jgi:hypothetical protein